MSCGNYLYKQTVGQELHKVQDGEEDIVESFSHNMKSGLILFGGRFGVRNKSFNTQSKPYTIKQRVTVNKSIWEIKNWIKKSSIQHK